MSLRMIFRGVNGGFIEATTSESRTEAVASIERVAADNRLFELRQAGQVVRLINLANVLDIEFHDA